MNKLGSPEVSWVIPVFRNAESLTELVRRVINTSETFEGHPAYEVILVDDGSDDESWATIVKLKSEHPSQLRALRFSRNFGQLKAWLAGYQHSRGRAIITISADLQDPPEIAQQMYSEWLLGNQVVVAERQARQDSKFTRFTSKIGHRLARLDNPDLPENGFDYFLMDAKLKETLLGFRGNNRYFQADLVWLGHRMMTIPYERLARTAGKSQWSFSKRFSLMSDILLDGSKRPLSLVTGVGLSSACLGFLWLLAISIGWFFGNTPFNGYAALMGAILISNGLSVTLLGVVGQYVWRIYDRGRERPHYVVVDEL